MKSVESAAITVARRSNPAQVRALAEGLLLGGYSFKVTNSPKPETLTSVTLVVDQLTDSRSRSAVAAGVVTATASALARDFANTPSSTKNPGVAGANRRPALARKSGLEVRVRDDRELRADGFGGVVAVGMGSASPPRLIELTYTPDPAIAVDGHVVLVGKGITFDSGGLSLKPNAGMIAMKTDMAAGGAIIAAMSVMRELGVRVQVTGLVPAAENMPSGSAQRPSDVITQYGGMTVEVLNTDAEGRLVLADALAYADAELDPDVIVDLATLTGAIASGLGKRHAGMFTEDDKLAAVLTAAGTESGEAVWRMPFVDDYAAALESSVADMANVAIDGGTRIQWRRDHRRAVPARVRRTPTVGASRYRRCRSGRGGRTRSHQGSDGFRRPAAAALAVRTRPAAWPAAVNPRASPLLTAHRRPVKASAPGRALRATACPGRGS